MYGEVPPVAEAVAIPSANPLQLTCASMLMDADNEAGSVMVVVLVAMQLLASVMVTV